MHKLHYTQANLQLLKRKVWITKMITIFTILAVLQLPFFNFVQADQIISTSLGKVQGGTATSRDGRTFHQFLGIPYAKAERFQPPTDADPWKDVRDATKQGQLCPQVVINLDTAAPTVFLGSEDCLNLNVFSPKLPQPDQAKVLLPVMVWFHGGGSGADGALNYDPQYYMDTDIVVVTFNARLGFLGYLNLGNELAPGNQRLKDQVLLLKWVQKNIENFGGDPSRVNLNGYDSGAAEAFFHILSPMSKGLFSGIIYQCGSPLMPHVFIRNPIYQAKKFGAQVGCPVESKEGLYECLKRKKPEDLVLSFNIYTADITENEILKFGPSVEHIDVEKAFMTEAPIVSLKEGRIANKVPGIMSLNMNGGFLGFTGKILADPSVRKKLNTNIKTILPRYLDYDLTASDPDAVTQKIMDKYFDGGEINETNSFDFVRLITYRFFSGPTILTGDYYPDYSTLYGLMMGYIPSVSSTSFFGYDGQLQGTYGDDISYQFPWTIYYAGINNTSKDYPVSKKIIQLLVSFMEMGKPTKPWGEIQSWLPYDRHKRFGVNVGKDGELNSHFMTPDSAKSLPFWTALLKNELASELENPQQEIF